MDKNLILNFGEIQNYSYITTLYSFILCVITSFVLTQIYKRFGSSLGSKNQITSIIPLISNITFLVILIIKSSLALSLGLVGALSIIRFRTPIKEPEDLGYLFFSIAIGIGFAAMQIVPTLIISSAIMLIIIFYSNRFKNNIDKNFNLIIDYAADSKEDLNMEENLKKFTQEIELIKIEKNNEKKIFYYNLIFNNNKDRNIFLESLNLNKNISSFVLYENRPVE